MDEVVVAGDGLGIDEVIAVALEAAQVRLSPESRRVMEIGRANLEAILSRGEIAYGVNTGVGEFENVIISPEKILLLQKNMVRSTASGVGNPLEPEVVRAMMLLRANALAKGLSGVRPQLVELLIEMLNRWVIPIVPSRGSVGSSGDLAPLAHIAQVIMGEGKALFHGEIVDGEEALVRAGLEPVELQAKEGLALINGTQLMSALGCLFLRRGEELLKAAQVALAMSLEALSGTDQAFDERLCAARPHPGQMAVARNLRLLLEGSEIIESHRECPKVQDAYTLRCAPQVLGAIKDTMTGARRVLEIEINSATDNPLILGDEVVSGGNFHGEPIALALDALGLAVHEISSFSERRTARLVDGKLSGLPRFLTSEQGIDSGMMIPQYIAAALTSESKLLAHSASADSIPTSANQEDFNSMGPIAALKLQRIVENGELVVSTELLCAAQALEFHHLAPSIGSRAALRSIRQNVDRLVDDRPLGGDIESIGTMIRSGQLLRSVEASLSEPLL